MNFSLEIGPTTDLETLPQVNDVYITMLPGGDYKETAQKAVELVKKGFNPVPHFPARSIHDEKDLKDTCERFRGEELEHRKIGLEHGAEQTPGYEALSALVKTGSRMAIWLSERI